MAQILMHRIRIGLAIALGLGLLSGCWSGRNGQDGMDGFGVAAGLKNELARQHGG